MSYLMFKRIIVLQYEIDAKKNTKSSHNALWDEATMKKKAILCSTRKKLNISANYIF